jgi:hypothetical protein
MKQTRLKMVILDRVREAFIVENVVENKLRWFKHVEKRPIDYIVKIAEIMEDSQITRGR